MSLDSTTMLERAQPREGLPLVERLDVHAGGLVQEEAQLPVLASISAGDRGEDGYPRASKDGTIVLHDPEGLAPGLAEMLKAANGKRLTVALPFNDLRVCYSERYKRYSRSRLEVYGDAKSITEILVERKEGKNGRETLIAKGHQSYPFGTEEYRRLAETCQIERRLLFILARWDGRRVQLLWPDGFGVYVLKTTSRHSAQSLIGSIELVRTLSRGRLQGVPFDLFLSYPEVARPTGERTKVPVWRALLRPPDGMMLDGATFGEVVGRGLQAVQQLQALPAPAEETLEDALQEPTAEELALVESGDAADQARWRKRFHAIADGTWYETEEGRAAFLWFYTDGVVDSLAAFLKRCTNDDAELLCQALQERVRLAPEGRELRLIAARRRREAQVIEGDAIELGPAATAETVAEERAATEPTPLRTVGQRIVAAINNAEEFGSDDMGEPELTEEELARQDDPDGLQADAAASSDQVGAAVSAAARRSLAELEPLAEAAKAEVRRLCAEFAKTDPGKTHTASQGRTIAQTWMRWGIQKAAGDRILGELCPASAEDLLRLSYSEAHAVLTWAAGPEAEAQARAVLAVREPR